MVSRARVEAGCVWLVSLLALLATMAIGAHTAFGVRVDKRLLYTLGGARNFFDYIHAFVFWVRPPVLAGIAVALIVAGLALRRPVAAFAAPAIFVGTTVGAQVLKRFGHEQMPSGHAAAGVGLAVAILVLAPRRWRLPALAVATFIATGVGIAAVQALRHRPGDVLAADLWCAAVTGFVLLACLLLRPRGRLDDDPRDDVPLPWPSVWRTVAAADLLLALVLLFIGAAYSNRPIDLLLMWVAHGVPALAVAALLVWTARISRIVLD